VKISLRSLLALGLIFAATAAGTAHADDSSPTTLSGLDIHEANAGGTQFFYQTAPDNRAITPGASYLEQKINSTNGYQTVSALLIAIIYEHGFTPMFSLGGVLAYESGSITQTGVNDETISGLANIILYGRGTLPMGTGAFKFGADLSVSPGNQTVSYNGNVNAFTGGQQIIPYVGYQHPMGPGFIGAKLLTQIDLGNRSQTNSQTNTTNKTSGMDTTEFDVFYELMCSLGHIGGALEYQSISSTDTNGTTSSNYSPFYGVKVYSAMVAGPGEILPVVDYAFTTDKNENGNAITSMVKWSVALGYRMTF